MIPAVLTLTLTFLCTYRALADRHPQCSLHGLIARCSFRISNITVDTEATVNICHEPTDVTFNIMAQGTRNMWQHTFASTNGAESRAVASTEGSTLMLHVVMTERDAVHLDIAAGYSWQSPHQIIWFLNDTVLIPPEKETCLHEELAASDATVGGLVTVVLLSAVCGMAAFVWKQHRHQKLLEQSTALDDANAYLQVVGDPASGEESPSPFQWRLPNSLVVQNLTAHRHSETVL